MIELAAIFFLGALFGVIIGGAVAYDKGFSAGYNLSVNLNKSLENRARDLRALQELGNGQQSAGG